MMRATKYILIACVVLNFLGHPTERKVIGWDYCTEEGHPFWLYVWKFGWPIPVVEISQIWGCTTTPNQWIEFSWPGLIGSQIFWIVAIWIIDTFWPSGCFGEWEIECEGWPCSDKEKCKKRTQRWFS